MRLGELLCSLKLISRQQLEQALEVQKASPAPLGTIVVGLGFVSEDQLLNALAAQYGVAPYRLLEQPPSATILAKISPEVARTYQVLPVEIRGSLLLLAMRNPLDIDAIDLAHSMSGMRIEPVLADSERLVRSIDMAYGSPMRTSIGSVDKMVMDAINDSADLPDSDVDEKDVDSKPVVILVNQIIQEAVRMGASDIHLEPRGRKIDVRYRVDGDLRVVREIPAAILPMLTTRLKIIAELDIVESRMPQDGRFNLQVDGREVDFRMSVLPNKHGQRIVLRVLDKSNSLQKLPELGFAEDHLAIFRNLVQKPYGLLLVTGPTGSGKTTTLYAALEELKVERSNIMTCEDPIEYDIEGINQSQVFEKVGLTFAAQLRAILRQDPDVILVGEIRDGETAQTAIRASMTGHLVLSTLHCNDAPSAIPRLFDMEADPFLLSTSLIGVLSQRLLRRLCPHCKDMREATDYEMDALYTYMPELREELPGKIDLAQSVGCPKCGGSGYKGRTAVHELMPVMGAVSEAIAARQTLEQIKEAAVASGYKPMQHAAMMMVLNGETTVEEARRHVYLETIVRDRRGNIHLAA